MPDVMRPLLGSWHQVSSRLRNAPLIALFLDFDGTLAPICADPEQVRMDRLARRSVAALARSRRFHVSIISGRRRADVRSRVRLPGVRYLGLHGWETHSGATPTEEARRALASFAAWLRVFIGDIRGVWIEEKEHSLAVHHRAAAPAERRIARSILGWVLEPFAARLRVENGKEIWEILPREFGDKGFAVARLLTTFPVGTVPIYLGDDHADEAAFAALPHGITVHVGASRPSQARFCVSGVTEVRNFLHKLQAENA